MRLAAERATSLTMRTRSTSPVCGRGNDLATICGCFAPGVLFYATVADAPHFRNGAELILIILLLAAGIIYVTFARNPMSFDDLIELRFLPSRRRPREPEYFEQLKSMTLPREMSYRVSRQDQRA